MKLLPDELKVFDYNATPFIREWLDVMLQMVRYEANNF